MVLWFLRLFAEFRDLESLAVMQAATAERERDLVVRVEELESELTAIGTDKVLLQDRLDSAIQDKDRLWETTNQALNGERYAYQTMVNHAIQKNGGGIPFTGAHSLPPSEIRALQAAGPIGRKARMLPSEMASRSSNQFVREFVEHLSPEKVG